LQRASAPLHVAPASPNTTGSHVCPLHAVPATQLPVTFAQGCPAVRVVSHVPHTAPFPFDAKLQSPLWHCVLSLHPAPSGSVPRNWQVRKAAALEAPSPHAAVVSSAVTHAWSALRVTP
jgi:hypothetical protein